MTEWLVGMKAECINDDWQHADRKIINNFPIFRAIYTVREIYPHPFKPLLYLRFKEIINEPVKCGYVTLEPCFNENHFRPLVETKTDISMLEKLLEPPKSKIMEPA